LPNKTKSATVAEPKLFQQLNNPKVVGVIGVGDCDRPLWDFGPKCMMPFTSYSVLTSKLGVLFGPTLRGL